MDYPTDSDHRPLRRIPSAVNAAISTAKTEADWHIAGHIFGSHLFDMWPEHRAIDEMHEPLAELMNYPPMTTDGAERTPLSGRIAALAFFYARAPAVIAAVPWASLDAFIDGAVERFFYGGAPAGVERHAVAVR